MTISRITSTLLSAQDLIVGDDTFITNDNSPLILDPLSLLANDTGDGLIITGLSNPIDGSVAFDSQGQIVFTPINTFSGSTDQASFQYTVTDQNGITSIATVFVNVNSTNIAPIASDDTAITDSDRPVTIRVASLLENDNDPDNNTIYFLSVSNANNGQVALDGDGNIIFTPNAGYTGPADFQYTIEDSRGATSTATVNLTVNAANSAPIAVDDIAITDQDKAITIAIASLLANDSDPEGDPISLLSITGGNNGTAVLDGNGNIIFTPNAGYAGLADFQYTIADSKGATATATVAVTVNAPPIAVNDTLITDRNKALTIAIASLLANDSDPEGDPISLLSVAGGNGGTVVLDGNGNIIFTPTPNYAGDANFQYTIGDSNGATSTATVVVTVNAVNRPPVAINNAVTTDQNKALTLPIAKLLINDTDPDQDPISLVSVSNTSNGQAILDGKGNIIFTPTANYVGNASFQYTIKDSQGASSTATVAVNVKAVRLTAMNDVAQAITNMPLILSSSTLINNDRDPGNNRITIKGVSSALNGRVALNSYGNVVFTPNTNYVGPAGFTYTIRNTLGATTTGRVTLNVSRSPKIAMGTNLTGVADWSTQIPFIDIFKSSRSWVWEDRYRKIDTNLDSNGWLTSVTPPDGIASSSPAVTFVFTGGGNKFSGGQYIVLYDGQGTIQYKSAATKNISLSAPGRDVINVDATSKGSVNLQITSTDPNNTGDYIRNIRIVPAQRESTYTNLYNGQTFNPSTAKIFNPLFTSRIAPFQSVRFMDWMDTNHSNQVNWSDRPTLNQTQWTKDGGVPVEVMVALANQGNFNPWFTMPHMVNDDYVRNFAQYVKDNLAPNKQIYVEYSNEAWNNLFSQNRWINAQANSVGLNGTRWYAQRSAEVINIWKDVFGTQANQIVGVLGSQASNIGIANTAIDYLKSTGNLSAIDAVAIAPYFGGYLGAPQYASQVQRLTVNKLFDELTQGGIIKNSTGGAAVPGGALQLSYSNMQNYATLASQNNLQLLAYEGGQHLVGYQGVENNNAITNLFIAANRDARMGQLYQQYLTRWNQSGGGLFMNFSDVSSPSKWGSWGMMEHLRDVGNSKYTSILQMAEAK
ncbi:MAG: hypothetical protein N5P05_002904 [Chroococcopsis gigantea SAG 12.99]|jgi:hypothetical protein|nr:tandem-95 repeat protein [Chlorogloea purpurea SAG 13.99]MDV3001298.1 hypothetical protein [Chroococcopsis gigantea SAG 12.99]